MSNNNTESFGENGELQSGKYLKTKITQTDRLVFQSLGMFDSRRELFSFLKDIGGRFGGSGGGDRYVKCKSLPEGINKKLEDFGLRLDSDMEYDISNISYPCSPLIKISNIYTQDEYYVLEDESGYCFHSFIEEPTKIKNGKPPLETESNLIRDLVIDNTGSLILIKDGNDIKTTIIGDDITVLDKEDGQVLVLNDNLFERLQIDHNGNQLEIGNPMRHSYGKIKTIKIDKNANFLLIISNYGEKSKLHILNRKDFSEVKTFDDIKDIIQIDSKNNIVCLDTNGKTININTNMDQFPRGYIENNSIGERVIEEIQDTTAYQLKETLEKGGFTLNPDLDTKPVMGEAIHGEIIEQIWSLPAGESTFQEVFDSADTIEEIESVQKLFLQIQKNPQIMSVPGITDGIESTINKKRFAILLESVKVNTTSLRTELQTVSSESDTDRLFSGLIHLEGKLKTIEKQRSQIPDVDQDLDREISEIAREISSTIEDIRSQNSSQVQSSLDGFFDKIDTYLLGINYLPQITSIYDTNIYKEAVRIIDFVFDEDDKKVHTKNLDDKIQSHINRVENVHKSQDNQKQNQVKEKVEEMNMQVSQIHQIIASIDDSATLRSLESSDPLVMKIYDGIKSLPNAEGDILRISLENIFKERKQEIRMSQLYRDGVSVSLDEYGIDTGLYYAEVGQKSVGFKLEGSRTAEGNIRLALHYDDGTVFDIDSYLTDPGKYAEGMIFADVPTELSQKDFIEHQKNYGKWLSTGKKQYISMKKKLKDLRQNDSDSDEYKELLKKYKKYLETFKSARILEYFASALANKLDLNPRSHLNLPDPRFIVLDEERDIFRKMSAGFSIQKQEQKGIEILEGDPGLGKTMMVEEFGAITNREVVRIQCSKMDPSDLFFSPQLKAGETSRQPAEWIKIMQKPGVLVLFDEIDKLDPQCFERLHRLFDSGRSIYDPQIGTIKAHPDCLFTGTRNSYEVLSNPIVSRASIMQINAPSEENEAFKVAKYTGIDYFKNVDFDEFKDLYSGNTTDSIKSTGSEKLASILENIRGTVKVFQTLREKQKSEEYNDKFEFEVSYRDAEQVFLRHIQFGESSIFKVVLAEVLIPKARAVVKDFEDKDIQEKVVTEAIEECFR